MRLSSSTSDTAAAGLFGPLTGRGGISDQAWLAAMLEVEAALAGAGARIGLIPAEAAVEIATACRSERLDLDDLGRRAVETGNPVAPMVRDVTAAVAGDARGYVHLGATSQDVIDSSLSLLAHRALGVVLDHLAAAAASCAGLAERHRDTITAGRTLLQQALPTTFGLRCAGWLVALDEAAAELTRVREQRLAVQLGGAAGTLAGFGSAGTAMVRCLAEDLGLAEPLLPWHTNRVRFAQLAAALGITAGVLGKIALDVILLAQTEIAEVAEAGGEGHGGSSTLPQKRNPIGAVLVSAAARRAPGLVATFLAGMAQEEERAAGAWHAEWETLTQLLDLVGTAAARTGVLLAGLRVDPQRMGRNLGLSEGRIMAESVAAKLTPALGRSQAGDLVAHCCIEAAELGASLSQVLVANATVRAHLSEAEIAAALDPAAYLGSAGLLIDRALGVHAGAGAGLA